LITAIVRQRSLRRFCIMSLVVSVTLHESLMVVPLRHRAASQREALHFTAVRRSGARHSRNYKSRTTALFGTLLLPPHPPSSPKTSTSYLTKPATSHRLRSWRTRTWRAIIRQTHRRRLRKSQERTTKTTQVANTLIMTITRKATTTAGETKPATRELRL